jgi:integrase
MKLTDELALSLPLPEGRPEQFYWDDGATGLALRVRSGSRRYIVQWRLNGKQRRETVGTPGKMKLAAARKVAQARIGQVALGIDPGEVRAKAKAETTANKLTFGAVADRYLAAKRSELRPSTFKAATRYLKVSWKDLAGKPIDSITRASIAATLQELIAHHGKIAAARARSNLSAMLAWSVREGLVDKNVAIATHRLEENEPRDRILDDYEIKLIWNALGDDSFGRCIRLLVLLGSRRTEVGDLQWSEINLNSGVMTIPGERTKSGKALTLGLPEAALDILRSTPRPEGQPFVFGKKGSAGFRAWSYCKVALDAKVAAVNGGQPLPHWTIHDLRRTARSGFGRVGTRPDVAERLVGHAVGSRVSRIYDKYSYEGEIRAALAKWANHVMAVVEGREIPSNVVPLTTASA